MHNRYHRKEETVKKECKKWLDENGWDGFPVVQGMYSTPGVADRIIFKAGQVAFVEFKSATGKLSAAQKRFAERVERQGLCYIVARCWMDLEEQLNHPLFRKKKRGEE